MTMHKHSSAIDHPMMPGHPGWMDFLVLLSESFNSCGCDGSTRNAVEILSLYWPSINLKSTVELWALDGGCCDCEILMNIDPSAGRILPSGVLIAETMQAAPPSEKPKRNPEITKERANGVFDYMRKGEIRF